MSTTREVLHSSKSVEWYTPPAYIAMARRVLGDQIDLDPASCAKANDIVRATMYFDRDGLEMTWRGRVWLNPPHGRNVKWWVQKLEAEYDFGHVTEAILLVNAATDAKWFQPLWKYTLCFPNHRIQFLAGDGRKTMSPTHASVFVYYGAYTHTFLNVFSKIGAVVKRLQDGGPTC